VITRKALALIVAVGLVPAVAVGVAVGVAVVVAGDRLRTVFADAFEREALG
jgi:hypothetical protein